MSKILTTFLLILTLSVGVVWAGDVEDADAAYAKKDYATALKKYKLAASNGNAEAPYTLGWMYHSGTGVVSNHAEATQWYRLAAARGNADALYMLSVFYKLGKEGIIQRDPKEALRLLRMAVEKGNADAQNALAYSYELGEGVVQNYAEALRLYKLAAAQNKVDRSLGSMYAKGSGVVQDYIRAHMWWNIAASFGDKLAEKNRDEIETYMTRQQVAEAQRMALDCQAKNFKNCD